MVNNGKCDIILSLYWSKRVRSPNKTKTFLIIKFPKKSTPGIFENIVDYMIKGCDNIFLLHQNTSDSFCCL